MSKTVACLAAAAIACTPQSTSLDVPSPNPSVAPVDASIAAPSSAPEASAAPVDAAPEVAASTSAPPPRKGLGASCSRDRECATGLACCETSFRGHCGGVNMPDQPQPPCVLLSTCAPAPCHPLALPP